MGILSAIFTGISGLTASSNTISVIGNNIANVNTPGFKESRANFGDLLNQSLGGSNAMQIGGGVQLTSVDPLFVQGAFQTTSVPTDLAIDGDGFFLGKDPSTGARFYTRTGDFTRDGNGNLVNPRDIVLQGFDVDANGNAQPILKDMNISGGVFPARITGVATVHVNLDANATPPGVAFNATNASTTSNFSTALASFDSLGNSHTVELYFQKQPTPANTWNWYAVANATDLTGTGLPASGLVSLARGETTFTATGALDTVRTLERINYGTGALVPLATPEQGGNVTFDFAGGASTGQSVTFNFGTPKQLWNGTTFTANPAAPSGFDGTVQFAAPSAAQFLSQDGFASGVLQNFSVDRQGIVLGQFSNGQSKPLMRVALARFPSPTGLIGMGNNLFAESLSSGTPVVASPGTSGLGTVVSSSLEISTVDLSTQFVELIRAQQAFQANARVITVGDELLTEVINIRR